MRDILPDDNTACQMENEFGILEKWRSGGWERRPRMAKGEWKPMKLEKKPGGRFYKTAG